MHAFERFDIARSRGDSKASAGCPFNRTGRASRAERSFVATTAKQALGSILPLPHIKEVGRDGDETRRGLRISNTALSRGRAVLRPLLFQLECLRFRNAPRQALAPRGQGSFLAASDQFPTPSIPMGHCGSELPPPCSCRN